VTNENSGGSIIPGDGFIPWKKRKRGKVGGSPFFYIPYCCLLYMYGIPSLSSLSGSFSMRRME
jgi:hypothetical protein